MKAIEFPEVNQRIAEEQEEFQTIPCLVNIDEEANSVEVHICLELSPEEQKQVAETGKVWFTSYQAGGTPFHPIRISFLKPDLKAKYKDPFYHAAKEKALEDLKSKTKKEK